MSETAMEKPGEEPQERPLSDEEGMQATLRGAEGVLMDAHFDALEKEIEEERAGQTNALEKGKETLDREADREKVYVTQKFADFLASFPPERDFYKAAKETFGWSKYQTTARLGALQTEFERLYNSEFDAPDEKRPEAGTRDSKGALKLLLDEDYGPEFAKNISPLVDIFVEKSIELIRGKEQKGENKVE